MAWQRSGEWVRLFCEFAFGKSAVRDLTQLGRNIDQRADVAPIDVFGVGVEMLAAEGLQAGEHGVDFGLAGHEGAEGLVVVAGLGGHAFAP